MFWRIGSIFRALARALLAVLMTVVSIPPSFADGTVECNSNVTGGSFSTECGATSVATGFQATAIGAGADAAGDNSTALATLSNAAGDLATAIGIGANAAGQSAIALGFVATASMDGSIAIGGDTVRDATIDGAQATGLYATAIGPDSVAAGQSATALGDSANAAGELATALGNSANAAGGRATALGVAANAAGEDATALGRSANAAGKDATALGVEANAAGKDATALGSFANAAGQSATALGFEANAAGQSATALGFEANASMEGSLAIGGDTVRDGDLNGAQATALYATAIGPDSAAAGESATALGDNANAAGQSATALGFFAYAAGLQATALGGGTNAAGQSATALGAGAQALGDTSIALGIVARTSMEGSIAIGGDTDRDGTFDGAQATGLYATAVGPDSVASGSSSISLGDSANAAGDFATALGNQANASMGGSIAIGDNANATGFSATSIGPNTTTTGSNSTAVGVDAEAVVSAVAVGRRAKALGHSTTALGRDTEASSDYSTAIGRDAKATAGNATAISRQAQATAQNSTAIGRQAMATHTNSMAIGFQSASNGIENIAIGRSLSTYTLAGLAGSGIRTVVVDSAGNLMTAATALASAESGSAVQSSIVSSQSAALARQSTRTDAAIAQPGGDPTDMAAQIASLFEMVDAAAQERSTLIARVEQLEQQFSDSEQALLLATVTPKQSADVLSPVPVSMETLEQAGFGSADAEAIVQLHQQTQWQALQLRDTATRDGWLISDQHHRAQNQLQHTANPMREQLGDTDYERYLIATEQHSRVILNTVLHNSPAEQAGLQTGDVIVDYAGKRVFNVAQMRIETATGDVEEQIILNVLRNAQPVQLFINRGPLGVSVYGATSDEALASRCLMCEENV